MNRTNSENGTPCGGADNDNDDNDDDDDDASIARLSALPATMVRPIEGARLRMDTPRNLNRSSTFPTIG